MSPLVETVLFVFGLVALGYLAAWTGYLKAETGDGIAEFAVGVALPLLLFRTMMGVDFHGAAPWRFWAAYFAAVAVTWTLGHLVVTRMFGREATVGVVGGVSAAFSNIVLLGTPLVLSVFGREGFDLLSLLIAVHLPTMLMASIVLFGILGREKGQPLNPLGLLADFARRVLTNPLMIGIFAGLLWRFAGLDLPALPGRLIDALAGIGSTLALFAVGLSLKKFGLSGNIRPALVLSVVKLGVMPALALCFAWLLDLPPLTAQVAVAAAALPAGVNSYLIATQFGTGQGLASNQMTISTAFAVFTTALWLTLAQHVFA